jgi:hypothetical protein
MIRAQSSVTVDREALESEEVKADVEKGILKVAEKSHPPREEPIQHVFIPKDRHKKKHKLNTEEV